MRQTQTTVDAMEQADLWRKTLEYDDGTAQTFMICMAKWFVETAGSPHLVTARVHVADILSYRGLKKKAHGGYDPQQKQDTRADILRLNELWVKSTDTVYERRGKGKAAKTVYVDSRLIEVAVETEDAAGDIPYAFRIRPGEWARPYLTEENRQTALLLRPIMQYDPRQGVERLAMRLGLYLTPQWRIRASHGAYDKPWLVRTLCEGTCTQVPTDARLYTRFLDQFEEALDRLKEDDIIASWHYGEEYETLPARGRFKRWLDCRVFISPPAATVAHYAELPRNRQKAIGATVRAAQAARGRHADIHLDRSNKDNPTISCE
jgi:hypothetical protein